MPAVSNAYRELMTTGGRAYIRAEALGHVAAVSALLFDCDGVLIDIRRSYDVAISRTVGYLLGKLFYRDFSPIATRRIIYRFRQSGGFNNDWDTACAILWGAFVQLDEALIHVFVQTDETIGRSAPADAAKRLIAYVREIRRRQEFIEVVRWRHPLALHEARSRLLALAEGADSSGLRSVDRLLREQWALPEWKKDALTRFQRFLAYPGAMGQSLVTTVFNELFYGADACRTAFGIEPRFTTGEGVVGQERPILSHTAARRLADLCSGRLGIVSGRRRRTAEQTLGDRLAFFHRPALVFLEDEYDRAEPATIAKPHPYGLLKAAAAIGSSQDLLYVGDSAEDLLMVEQARLQGIRCAFCGVYRYGYDPAAKIRFFLAAGASLVIPSVNDLPEVLHAVRG
jgi:phosphoglycolate phosphatase-like HAD superfamily hydrolase